jgi:hypothetical protein
MGTFTVLDPGVSAEVTAAPTSSAGACCTRDAVGCSVTESANCAFPAVWMGPGTRCGAALCPYVDPLPIPSVLAPSGTTPEGFPLFVVRAQQFSQALHRDLPPTTVWGYEVGWLGGRLPRVRAC